MKYSPAAERNQAFIAEVFEEHVKGQRVLEIASGSGQHCAHLAPLNSGKTFQPSDRDSSNLESINGWTSGLQNVLPAKEIDTTDSVTWAGIEVDAILCANMIHIAPYEACEGLAACAQDVLSRAGCLMLYGPFFFEDKPAAPSNLDFDASLKSRDPSWGIRHLEQVEETFLGCGLKRVALVTMPANNFSVIFSKNSDGRRA